MQEQEKKIQELGKTIQALQEQLKGLEGEYGSLSDREADKLTTAFLALTLKQLVLVQKDYSTVQAFVKDLASKERKIVEVTKTPLEDLNRPDPDKLKQAMAIIGPEQFNFALADAFLKELTSGRERNLDCGGKNHQLGQNSYGEADHRGGSRPERLEEEPGPGDPTLVPGERSLGTGNHR